jgi:hypothetical protein
MFTRVFPSSRLPLAAAFVLATSALATVIRHETIEQMAQHSPVIVRGRVGQISSTWDEGHRRISTYAEVMVTDTIKGDVPKSILVRQPGGEIGPVGQAVAGVAHFTVGEDTVLLLEPAPDEAKTWVVYALSAGKFDAVEHLGVTQARRMLRGLTGAEAGSNQPRALGDEEFLGPIDAFLARLRAAVAR